jgi:MraZ protein
VFRGTFHHSIDAKGRTSLPARFREVLAGRSEEQLVVTQGPDGALWCLPPSAWAEIEKKVRAMPQFDPVVRRLMRSFVSPAQDCPFDKMGRILVPQTLREYAGLQGDVVWAGMIDRVELWDSARWKKTSEEDGANFGDPEYTQRISELGL